MHLAIRRSSYCRIFLQCYSVKREITCTDLWCSLHELFPIWHLGKKSELVILQNIHSLKQEKNHHLIQQQLTIFKSHNILRSTIVKSCNKYSNIHRHAIHTFTVHCKWRYEFMNRVIYPVYIKHWKIASYI